MWVRRSEASASRQGDPEFLPKPQYPPQTAGAVNREYREQVYRVVIE
jgi:hypothetical protein